MPSRILRGNLAGMLCLLLMDHILISSNNIKATALECEEGKRKEKTKVAEWNLISGKFATAKKSASVQIKCRVQSKKI